MRLVWRIHLGPYNWASPLILAQLFADLADFVAVRQNLRGIKARAEGRRPERQRSVYAELVLWVACFVDRDTDESRIVMVGFSSGRTACSEETGAASRVEDGGAKSGSADKSKQQAK
jgi:hypothetical protein